MLLDINEDNPSVTGFSFRDSSSDLVEMELSENTDRGQGRVHFRWAGYESFDYVNLNKQELKGLAVLIEKTLTLSGEPL
jgi:hypothetical protein